MKNLAGMTPIAVYHGSPQSFQMERMDASTVAIVVVRSGGEKDIYRISSDSPLHLEEEDVNTTWKVKLRKIFS